jgi:hypothetical protein
VRFDLQRFQLHRLEILSDAPEGIRVTKGRLSMSDVRDHAFRRQQRPCHQSKRNFRLFRHVNFKKRSILSVPQQTRADRDDSRHKLWARQILDDSRNSDALELGWKDYPPQARIFISALRTFSSGRAFQMTFLAAP